MDMGVFSNNGISFSDGYYTSEHVFTIHNFIFSRMSLGENIDSKLVNVLENIYLLGTIPMNYEDISLEYEKDSFGYIKTAVTSLIDTIKLYLDSNDYTGLFDTTIENEVVDTYNTILDSKLARYLLLPIVNMAYFAFAEDNIFVLFDAAD